METNERNWTVVYFDGKRRTVRATCVTEAKQRGRELREVWVVRVFPSRPTGNFPTSIFEGKGAP